ncbi:hypothetical protein N0V95_005031 [Ascochyta clinopodiicola]|nr:hypothetical protein N0V95_005031 [Ascochyta clinopodiicola]
MKPKFQNYLPAAPPLTAQPPRLAVGGEPREAGYLSNAPAAPSASLFNHTSHPPAHLSSRTPIADYKHDATPAASFITVWTARLKKHCKKVARSLTGTFKGLSRQERDAEDAATLSTITPNTVTSKLSACCGAIQSDAIQSGDVHGDANQSGIPQNQTIPSNTWIVLINIFYAISARESDILRSAKARFDSQSPVDIMSSTYAAMCLGIHFDNPDREPIGRTITGEIVYSIGQVSVRWAPPQDGTLSSQAGDKITLTAKTHHTTFYVTDSDCFDVIIGHPTLMVNGLYGEKPKLLNPFTSLPQATSNSAQDQEYLRRMEAERLAVARLTQQQTQDTSKK